MDYIRRRDDADFIGVFIPLIMLRQIKNTLGSLMLWELLKGMAGVPPTLGFYAKFTVLQAALQAGFIWAVVFAVLMAAIGAFYYLRIVKLMYFDAPKDSTPINAPIDMQLILSINAIALLLLGIMNNCWLSCIFSACISAK